MEKNVALELTQKAFAEDAVPALLKGEAPYALAPGRSFPGSVPVDWERLLQRGILPYCRDDPKGAKLSQLFRAVDDLLAGDAVSVWCAYRVYVDLYLSVYDREEYAHVLHRFPVKAMRQALMREREALTACRRWDGRNDPEGLWGNILGLDDMLESAFHMGVLPE